MYTITSDNITNKQIPKQIIHLYLEYIKHILVVNLDNKYIQAKYIFKRNVVTLEQKNYVDTIKYIVSYQGRWTYFNVCKYLWISMCRDRSIGEIIKKTEVIEDLLNMMSVLKMRGDNINITGFLYIFW